MKKNILALLMLIAFVNIVAQENSDITRGRLSFKFNKSELNGPVNAVIIRKENNILISLSAYMDWTSLIDDIHLEFAIPSLTNGVKVIDSYTAFDYELKKTADNNNDKSDSFHFSSRGENAHYSSPYASFEYPKSPTRVFVDEISFQNGKITIKGRFSGIYANPDKQLVNVSKFEISDGKFEVIL